MGDLPKTSAGEALSRALGEVSKGVIAFYDTDDLHSNTHRTSYRRKDTRPNIATSIDTIYKNLAAKPDINKPERTFAIAVANLFRNMIISGRGVGGFDHKTDLVVREVRDAAHAAAASIDRTYGQLVDEDDEILALAIDLYVVNEDQITGDNPFISALELVLKVLNEQHEDEKTNPVARPHLSSIADHVRVARDKIKQIENARSKI